MADEDTNVDGQSKKKKIKIIGSISGVLLALGLAEQVPAAGPVKARDGSKSTIQRKGVQPAGPKELARMVISKKLVISKILSKSGRINLVASGFNQTNEYTQGGGSDTFTQYSQNVDRTRIQNLVQTRAMRQKIRKFQLQRQR